MKYSYVRKNYVALFVNTLFKTPLVKSTTFLRTNSIQYSYDVSGNKTSMISDAGTFTYDYDDLNRLTGVTNHKDEVFGFNYDVNNRLLEINRPGSKTRFDFDVTSFINNITHTKINTSVINFFDYSRDAIGNRTEVRSPASITNYDYDQNNQLIASSSSATVNETFVYDPLGNRITDVNGNYVYDDKFQRIKEDYQYFYTFDDDGNLNGKISKNDQQNYDIYVHNSENKLISIRTFAANVLSKEVNYTYDVLGRRVEKQIIDHQDSTKDFTRRFVYDGSEALMELDETNTILATYTHSTLRTDDVLSIDVTSDGVTKGRALASGSFYYLKDAQGTITDITDGNGDLIQHYDYLSFGKLYKVTGPAGTDITALPTVDPYFTYTNREFDKESGLYYYRARYYDSGVGRFLEEDPDGGALPVPISFVTKYTYVANNPTRYIDPTGYKFTISKLTQIGKDLIDIPKIATKWVINNPKKALITAAIIVATVYTGGAAAVLIGTGVGGTLGYISTGTALGAFTGALGGAVSGGIVSLALIGASSVATGALYGALGGLAGTSTSNYITKGSFKVSAKEAFFSITAGAIGGSILGGARSYGQGGSQWLNNTNEANRATTSSIGGNTPSSTTCGGCTPQHQ